MAAIHDVVLSAANVTANGSVILPNKQDDKMPFIDLLIRIATAPTGTTPSLVFTVGVSEDGVNFDPIFTGTALTATGYQRQTWAGATALLEPWIQVSWAIAGTTPAFPSVSADVLWSNPADS